MITEGKVSYQVPRAILARIWWRRFMLKPRMITLCGALVAISIVLLLWPRALNPLPAAHTFGLIGLGFLLIFPIALFGGLTKAAGDNAQWTDPRTLEFGPSGLVVSGTNWKSELPWTHFKGFSEDAFYFYLHLGNVGVDSVIPKDAFSQELMDKFRRNARAGICGF